MHSVMVLSGRGFGRCLSHESRALIDGISAFIKETPDGSLTSSTMGGYNEKSANWRRRGTSFDHAGTLMSDFAPRTVRNAFMLLITYLVYGILL